MADQQLCTYVAGLNGKQITIKATSLYGAKIAALQYLKPRKRDLGLVWVKLTHRADGTPVTHLALD